MAIQSTNAQVFCNIGPVIDGNIADEYAQGSGLVRTRGSIRLDGVFSPDVGSDIDIGYVRLGQTIRFPRSLQVLSVFADPFKRITTISVGCKITLVDDLRPPEKDPSSKEENGDVPCEVFKNGPILPISAAYIVKQILSAMGISGAIPPLTNKFSTEEFDMSPGYTTVLSDLLVSENYVGFIAPDRTFKTKKLQDSMGSGALVEVDKVLEFSQVGFGELPGKAVIVRYSSLKLKSKEELDALLTPEELEKRNWESEKVIGSSKNVYINATNPDGTLWQATFGYQTYTYTKTIYDSWDRVTESYTTVRGIGAEYNGSYVAAAVEHGSQAAASSFGGNIADSLIKTTFKYKVEAPPINNDPEELASECVEEKKPEDYAEVLSQVTTERIPETAIIGQAPVQYLATDALGVPQLLYPGGFPDKTASITRIEYEKDKESGITKTITRKTICYARSGEAQQEMAWLSYKARSNAIDGFSEADANSFIIDKATKLVDGGSEMRIRTEREYGLQKRPSNTQRSNSAYSKPSPAEQVSEVEWVSGGTSAQLQREFQLPYAPDDIINWTELGGYTSTPSDAPAKAAAYGEMQNKLFLGSRNGLSIKTTPELLPTEPLSPFYISGGGYTGSYLTNGMAWTFGPESIAVGTDGLYWGAVGTDGAPTDSWIPLAPGVTLPPIGTPIVDNAPVAANSIPTPIGFNPNAPGSIFTSLPTNSPGTFTETLVSPTIYPPYKKIVSVLFDISVGLEATFLPYNANGNTKDVEFITEFYLAEAQEFRLLASKGSFVLTKNNAVLTTTGSQSYPILASRGQFILDRKNIDVTTTADQQLLAERRSFVFTGYDTKAPWNFNNTTTSAWWDFSDSATVTTGSGKVTQINDKSGNNRHLFHASSDGPVYTTSLLNSLNGAVFDGVSQSLTSDGVVNWTMTNIVTSSAYSCYFVAKVLSAADNNSNGYGNDAAWSDEGGYMGGNFTSANKFQAYNYDTGSDMADVDYTLVTGVFFIWSIVAVI